MEMVMQELFLLYLGWSRLAAQSWKPSKATSVSKAVLCLLWMEVELKCGLLALGTPGVKAEDSLAEG